MVLRHWDSPFFRQSLPFECEWDEVAGYCHATGRIIVFGGMGLFSVGCMESLSEPAPINLYALTALADKNNAVEAKNQSADWQRCRHLTFIFKRRIKCIELADGKTREELGYAGSVTGKIGLEELQKPNQAAHHSITPKTCRQPFELNLYPLISKISMHAVMTI